MLASDLSVNSQRASVTLPGLEGAITFAQVTGPSGQKIVRREAATANTTPKTLTISHEISGSGFKQRCRTLVRVDFEARNTDIADTGGVTPSCSGYFVLDRPIQSGGAISETVLKNVVGYVLDVLTASGNLTKLLNQEA